MPRPRSDDTVDQIKSRLDLVEVVQQYVPLRKRGRELWGLCPFHPEKTPSLSVSPTKQVYYCFGCGEGGDVFRFLRKVENLEFAEVVERLARTAGVTLRYEGDSEASRRAAGRRNAIHKAIDEAAKNPGGAAGAGLGIGAGIALGQQMGMHMNPTGSPSSLPAAFFVAVNGTQTGPFDMNTLATKTRDGSLTPETLVWRQGMAGWAGAGAVPEFQSLFAATPPPLPKG